MNNSHNRAQQHLLEHNLFSAKVALDGVHTVLAEMEMDKGTGYDTQRMMREDLADTLQRQVGLLERMCVDMRWHEGEVPTARLSLFDICLSDYLADHANGEREVLVAVSLHERTLRAQVRVALFEEWKTVEDTRLTEAEDSLPPQVDMDHLFRKAVDDYFEGADMSAVFFTPDGDVDPEDDSIEHPCAWFRFTF